MSPIDPLILVKRVLVLGLDGVSLDLLIPWIKEGHLPNLRKIMEKGAHGKLDSTPPFNTAGSWTSITTGVNPGKHGIFDFFTIKEGTYETTTMNASFRKTRTIWEILSQKGMKSIVVNVPFTYPPRRFDGIIITGLMTPLNALNIFALPEITKEMERDLGEMSIQASTTFQRGWEEPFIKDVFKTTENVGKISQHLMKKYDWSFFMVVFFDSDRIQHALWGYMDEDHPQHEHWMKKYGDAILQYFQHIDGIIGELIEDAGKDTAVLIVSDHGMGSLTQRIHTNNILKDLGFIRIKRTPPSFLRHKLYQWGFDPRYFARYIRRIPRFSKNVAADYDRFRFYRKFDSFFDFLYYLFLLIL